MKIRKTILLFLIFAFLIGLFSGCGNTGIPEKEPSMVEDNYSSPDLPDGSASADKGEPFDKTTASEYDTAQMILAMLTRGRPDAILDLCAVEEYLDSNMLFFYSFMSGYRPLTDYEMPDVLDETKTMRAYMLRAQYASDISAMLFELISANSDEDYGLIDRDDIRGNVSKQIVAYEKELEAFDFSSIHVEYLCRFSMAVAIEEGMISEEYADLVEILPLLREYPECADTYATDFAVYAAVVTCGEGEYTLYIPLVRYEEGWRLQRLSYGNSDSPCLILEPLEKGLEKAVAELRLYGELDFDNKQYGELNFDKNRFMIEERHEADESLFSSADEAADAFVQKLTNRDYDSFPELFCIMTFMEQLDHSSWTFVSPIVHSPFALGSALRNGSIAFPTAMVGFSGLSYAEFIGSTSGNPVQTLWSRACAYAASETENSLPEDAYGEFTKQYIQNYYQTMIGLGGQSFPSEMTMADIACYQENYPIDLACIFEEKLGEFWSLLATAESASLKDYGLYTLESYFGGSITQYKVAFSGSDYWLELFVSKCGDGYRLAAIQ